MLVLPPPPLVVVVVEDISCITVVWSAEKSLKNFRPFFSSSSKPYILNITNPKHTVTNLDVEILCCRHTPRAPSNDAAVVDRASGNAGRRRVCRRPRRKKSVFLVFARAPLPRASSCCFIIIIIIIIIIVPEDEEETKEEELWGVLLLLLSSSSPSSSSSSSSSSSREHHHHHQSRRRIRVRLCAGETTTVFHESTTFVDAGVVVSNAALRGEE